MNIQKPFRTERAEGLLTVYGGNQPVDASAFQTFLDCWAEQLASGERFGVILVYEAHERSCKERNAQEEDRFTHAMSEFRRRYRHQTNERCTGFSRVFPAEWLAGMDEEKTAQYEAQTSRLAAYTFGVRGKNFTSLDEAKGWLGSVASETPLDLGEEKSKNASHIGFYYGSTTGTTQFVAEKMQDFAKFAGFELNPINISNLNDPRELLEHNQLILGIPTWNVGQLQDDWLILYPKLDELDFSGKQVALFGVGDQLGYPENFLDALGTLSEKLRERSAKLSGYWPTEGYDFIASKAQEGNQFVGLGIDEYNQEDLTDGRIARWLRQIQREFGMAKREEVKQREEVRT